jgi:hypothetical protein
MAVLLVTDIPPATNYSGGVFVDHMLQSIDCAVRDVFVVLNPRLVPQVPRAAKAHLRMETAEKPNELYRPGASSGPEPARIREQELASTRDIADRLLPAVLRRASRSGASAFWVVLEGQTMIRLAYALMAATPLPVYVQIWDPPASWLRAHGVDPVSTAEVLGQFGDVLRRAAACAASSWAMAAAYRERHGVRAVPVVPSLPASIVRRAARGPTDSSVFRIGFAGQLYARREWQTLLTCLDSLQWCIGDRKIEIHAFAQQVPEMSTHARHVRLYPWQATAELITALSRCDLQYCAYWFDETFREDAELCFPSKLSTYLATGRPVLFHGPAYASPSRCLTRWNAAFICNSPGPVELATVLRTAVTDPPRYAATAENGRRAFDRYLTYDHLARSLREFLGPERLSPLGGALA